MDAGRGARGGFGIPFSNHIWPEISAQLVCATPTAHFVKYANWWNPVPNLSA
jgi:mandelate racemase